MPVSQLVFFVCWLAAALLAGALLFYVWQKLHARRGPG
jgi:hypothetical protein